MIIPLDLTAATLAMLFGAFAIGACIGSFLNVCIARWPAEQSVVKPRSRCPKCRRQLSWYENVPMVSWLVQRGRCRGCSTRISVQYPAVELLVGLGWLCAVWSFGPGFTALRVAVFGTVLMGIAVTDAKHYVIPDGFTVFGLLWCLVTSVVAFAIGDGEGALFAGPYDALIGACAGAGALAIVGWLGEVALRREAMGFGDVTLMAVVGAALGPARSLLTIFVAAALASVVFIAVIYPALWIKRVRASRQGELALAGGNVELPNVPFGVFLAPAALLTLLWGRMLLDWYTQRILGS